MKGRSIIITAAVFIVFAVGCAQRAYTAGDEQSAPLIDKHSDTAKTGDSAKQEDTQKAQAEKEYFIGISLMTHNRYDKAITHLETAVALDPASYNAHVMLARSYAEAGRDQDSVKTLEGAIGLEPSNYKAYDLLMELYLYMGKPKKSLETAQAAIKAGVDENRLLDLGWTYYQLGNNDEAEARFKKYIEVYGESYGPIRNLGLVEFSRGNYKKALEYFDKAEKFDESNVSLPYIKALTYEKLGMTDEARQAAMLYRSRDKDFMNNIAKNNKNYFPHTDPGSVYNYIFVLKDNYDQKSGDTGQPSKDKDANK
jgi:tetratricopeptide (TPR) repeat protein